MPIKADPQELACSSENHNNDHSLMPMQDARSDDFTPRTLNSEECMRPTKVGSRDRQSFPVLIIVNHNGNKNLTYVTCHPHVFTFTEICCRVKNLPLPQ